MRSLNLQHHPMVVTVCYKNQVFEDPLTAVRVLVIMSNICQSGTDKLSLRLFYEPKTDIFQIDII